MIAMLLTAVMVTSIFSVSLTARAGAVRNDRRLICGQAIKQLTLQLRGFVTADPSPLSVITGPGAGAKGWDLHLTAGAGGPIGDSQLAVWALNPGLHTLTNYLPPLSNGVPFELAPYNARVSYTVTVAGGGNPMRVDVSCTWTEP